MTTTDQIKILCVRMGISVAELERQIEKSQQNFNTKIKRRRIIEKELI